MNERILQLAADAKIMTEESINMKISFNTQLKAFAETFSKLIVKEMCDMMEQAEDDAYHCIDPSERPTEYIVFLYDWRERFEKHFGEE